MRHFIYLVLLASIFFLNGCISINENFAPVMDVNVIEPVPRSGTHRVMSDETLYSIAWRYGLDYQDLARRNRIPPSYHIKVGQIIYLTKNKPLIKKRPDQTSITTTPQPIAKKPHTVMPVSEKEPTGKVPSWHWPAHGSTIGTFSALNKGINISGQEGDPILATAAGKVVYSGNGLRGYGNLIIIKHNSTFLTAYAHNHHVFVKDGEWVKAGQKIAEMGSTGAKRVMLHFEIRRNGKPVNPLIYLDQKI